MSICRIGGLLSLALLACRAAAAAPVSVDEAIASGPDLWGEAALRQPGGPSYDYFARLLPPPRYVDTAFHHYPIVLSAPGSTVKARLVSNGSQLNALARQPNWRGEIGVPVAFCVGLQGEPFGQDLHRLDGPKYARGYLPIVQFRYRQSGSVYTEEAFAGVSPEASWQGVTFLRFGVERGVPGKVTAQFEGAAPWVMKGGSLRDAQGRLLAAFDGSWTWNVAHNMLTAYLKPGQSAVLAVSAGMDPAQKQARVGDQVLFGTMDAAIYDQERSACERCWNDLLHSGMEVDVPEPVVDHAWRALVAGSFALLHENEIRYSAGNQYAKLYVGEGSDAARSLLLWGHRDLAWRWVEPLYQYTRAGLEFHQAAFKLQMLAHYYWLTRDRDKPALRALRPRWEKELNVILNGIEPASGLLPREKYCGDIDTRVYSLNSNANCWRALRDMRAVLADLGDLEWSDRLAPREAAFRVSILNAVEKSVRKDVTPNFVPVALFGEEQPYYPIHGSRMGGYYDLMAPYVLGSGVFRPDSETATSLMRYLREKGGLCMGLIRSHPNPSFWVEPANINHLYGLRYTQALLRRDEADRALVPFYATLAQGLTRDTFIGAEGVSIRPLDAFGRQMYLPPNSAANAHFLWTLRGLLVQDWDLDDDGRPETLRLLYATPRAWLRDGAAIRIRRAPTAFGEIGLTARSALAKGEVTVEADLPSRAPARTLLRLRLPTGWRVTRAEAGGAPLRPAGPETFDLTGETGHVTIRARVARMAAIDRARG